MDLTSLHHIEYRCDKLLLRRSAVVFIGSNDIVFMPDAMREEVEQVLSHWECHQLWYFRKDIQYPSTTTLVTTAHMDEFVRFIASKANAAPQAEPQAIGPQAEPKAGSD